MIQKVHPEGLTWVPSSRLMWADQLKKLTAVPSIYKEVHALCMQKIKVFNTLVEDIGRIF